MGSHTLQSSKIILWAGMCDDGRDDSHVSREETQNKIISPDVSVINCPKRASNMRKNIERHIHQAAIACGKEEQVAGWSISIIRAFCVFG